MTDRKETAGTDRPSSMVREFYERYGLGIQQTPTEASRDLRRLRMDLLTEEFHEYLDAESEPGNLVGVADALADIVYVAFGTALEYGIDLDAVLAEVHRSNMTKAGTPGGGGKVVKGDTYEPPDIAAVLARRGT